MDMEVSGVGWGVGKESKMGNWAIQWYFSHFHHQLWGALKLLLGPLYDGDMAYYCS